MTNSDKWTGIVIAVVFTTCIVSLSVSHAVNGWFLSGDLLRLNEVLVQRLSEENASLRKQINSSKYIEVDCHSKPWIASQFNGETVITGEFTTSQGWPFLVRLGGCHPADTRQVRKFRTAWGKFPTVDTFEPMPLEIAAKIAGLKVRYDGICPVEFPIDEDDPKIRPLTEDEFLKLQEELKRQIEERRKKEGEQ